MDINVCRVCLVKSTELTSIFTCETSFILTDFIAEFTKVNIVENDELPSTICKVCLEKLCMVYELKSMCIESDRSLRAQNRVKQENKEHPERSKTTNEFLAQLVEIKNEKQEYFADIIAEPDSDSNAFESFPNKNSPFDDSDDNCTLAEIKKKTGKKLVNEKSHQCLFCGKIFSTASHLKGHELTHTQDKKYECQICNKRFLINSYLTRHMKGHKNERTYKCNQCSKAFNTSNTLNDHFRLVHSGDKSFVCTFCNKGFPLKQQLHSHNRIHTGEKPHECHLCEKKYSHKIDLKRHIMLHTGVKPYKCPYCERTFTKKSNMDCHIPVHTGVKPYKCNICFKEFRQPCPYKKHMKQHKESGDQMPEEKVFQYDSSIPNHLK
ncbi:unnamed protein product [Diamesa tonsa]